jgi:hypothetical protein
MVGKFRLELEDFAVKKLDEKKAKEKANAKKNAAIEKRETLNKQREEEKAEKIAQHNLERKKVQEAAAFMKA